MEKREVVNFLKEETCIEWLETLNKFLKSYIDFLKIIDELEKEMKKEQS